MKPVKNEVIVRGVNKILIVPVQSTFPSREGRRGSVLLIDDS